LFVGSSDVSIYIYIYVRGIHVLAMQITAVTREAHEKQKQKPGKAFQAFKQNPTRTLSPAYAGDPKEKICPGSTRATV